MVKCLYLEVIAQLCFKDRGWAIVECFESAGTSVLSMHTSADSLQAFVWHSRVDLMLLKSLKTVVYLRSFARHKTVPYNHRIPAVRLRFTSEIMTVCLPFGQLCYRVGLSLSHDLLGCGMGEEEVTLGPHSIS